MTQTSPETRRLTREQIANIRRCAPIAVPAEVMPDFEAVCLQAEADADALAALQAKVKALPSFVNQMGEDEDENPLMLCSACGAEWVGVIDKPRHGDGCLEVERRSWTKEAHAQAD